MFMLAICCLVWQVLLVTCNPVASPGFDARGGHETKRKQFLRATPKNIRNIGNTVYWFLLDRQPDGVELLNVIVCVALK